MSYAPSSFLAVVCNRSAVGDLPDPGSILGRRRHPTTHRLETPSHLAAVAAHGSCRFAIDPGSGLQVLLHGEILGAGSDPAQSMAGRLGEGGDAAARELRGSFAAIVADPRRDRISVLTDRVNSRRVYGARGQDGVWLSTEMRDHAGGREADPIGVAWYLSNGEVHAGRTLLQGVTVLERASWTDVGSPTLRGEPYWRFEPGHRSSAMNEAKLSAQLAELIVAAVRTNVADDPDLFVSLSGGYDASAIVGALAFDLGVPDVECFSYVLSPGGRGTDEHVAGGLARLAGYPYSTVRSYDGDLVGLLRANAEMGGGLKDFVHEADAWATLGGRFAGKANPVVLAGDECFGGAHDHTLSNKGDALRSVSIKGFGVLGALAPLLDPAVTEVLQAGLEDDTTRMLARFPSTGDLRDTKDFLYLDQRLANVIAPWREGFAMRYATLRNPLLDNDILDFVAELPSSLRRTKVLFRRTVKQRYPSIFALPRAKQSNYMLDLPKEMIRAERGLRALATTGASPLDEIVPPSATLALLDDVLARASARIPPAARAKAVATDTARALLPPGASNKLRRYRPPAASPPVAAATLVARILILRMALADGRSDA